MENSTLVQLDERTAISNDPEILLEKAKTAPMNERPEVLKMLVKELSRSDAITVAHYAQQVKEYGLSTKTAFMEAVKVETRRLDVFTFIGPKTPTDDELRDRWLVTHPKTVYGLGDFRRYEDGIWNKFEDLDIKREIGEEIEKTKSSGTRPTAGKVRSVFELARAKVFVPTSKWDANPDILVFPNGTLHIPTRQLRDHDPNDYVTSGLPFSYDPDASAPTWNYILKRLESNNPGITNFHQEYAGYCLTTEVDLEIALLLYGPRGGGKSTYILGLETMLGERAGVFGLAELTQSHFMMGVLMGKTLVTSTETPGGSVTVTNRLNAIISGEKLTIDRKFKDPIEFSPYAKIIWSTTKLPSIKDPGDGLFRRLKIIPFPALSKESRDPNVKEKIRHEGPGILNWALDGLARLRSRGKFLIPDSVTQAMEDFQQMNDTPQLFVKEMCVRDPEFRIQSSVLYQVYKTWCKDSGFSPLTITALAEGWKRLGFERKRINGRTYYQGIKVRDYLLD